MSNIQQLIEAGPDAFTNLYDVNIFLPQNIMGNQDSLLTDTISVRIQDFPFPPMAMNPYNIAYKSVVLKRFAPKIVGTRKLSIPIRIDNTWELYKIFKSWKKLYMNDDLSDISFDNFPNDAYDTFNYGKILVKSYTSSTSLQEIVNPSEVEARETWRFYNVACINVQEPQFTRESANPITLNVDFLFGVYVPAGETDPLYL